MGELFNVRQIPIEPTRRWFSNGEFNLIVWYGPDEAVEGFELSYGKADKEKVVRWFAGKGLFHYDVDSGEQSPLTNRAPMLVALKGRPEMGRLLASVEASETWLPVELRALILGKLSKSG